MFDLEGLVRLALIDERPAAEAFVTRMMAPYRPQTSGGADADVILAASPAAHSGGLLDIQGDAGDGVWTAGSDDQFYLLHRDCRVQVPTSLSDGPVSLVYDRGFPLQRVFRELVRPLLGVTVLNHSAVTVHGTAVELQDGAVVICGWSESGKTETALALAERGARVISDKWTILSGDRTVHPFPGPVGIRDWVLEYLPQLRTSLGALPLARLRAGRMIAAGGKAAAGRLSAGTAYAISGQLEQLASLGTRLSLPLAQLASVYGEPSQSGRRLTTLVLLTTVSGGPISASAADPAWAALRLARSAAYERRALHQLEARARYAGIDAPQRTLSSVAERERELLQRMLSNVSVVQVTAPFPTDPHRVADVVQQWRASRAC